MQTREPFQELFQNPPQQPEKLRPLQLSDFQDKKDPQPDRFTEHSTVVAGASLISLVGLTLSRPMPPDCMLSAETSTLLRNSTREMRQMLMHDVLIPTEQAISRLGWQRIPAGVGGEPFNSPIALGQVAWRVPPGREILSRTWFDAGGNFDVLCGKQGLPAQGHLWRNVDGTVFHADPVAQPSFYRLRTELLNTEMQVGARNGVLTPREARLVNRLTAAELEMHRLSALESQLVRDSVLHLPQLQPYGSASGTTSLGEPGAIGRHNSALATARNEIVSAEEVYSRATRNAWKSAGSLIGSQVLNYHIDRQFFKDAPISIRTSVIDGVSPFIAMTRFHWSAKAAVMVGSHVSSRWFDADATRK